ncbi:MAG: hypothetical protein IH793_05955, partial [Acidobacteria bacterium]|nr:hypothetical protein [Acidobacteriota bacterium]
MISTRLKQFLDDNQVGYDLMQHDPAFTAQQLAARMHVPGNEFVKVVVVKMDGAYALAALCEKDPTTIVAAKNGGSPMILGLGEKQSFLASDIPAILPYTRSMAFIEDGGYERPELWLSEGWRTIHERQWTAPLYWERLDGAGGVQTLSGMQPLDQHGPVAHI